VSLICFTGACAAAAPTKQMRATAAKAAVTARSTCCMVQSLFEHSASFYRPAAAMIKPCRTAWAASIDAVVE
jgi:hypothetical protein